MPPPDRPRVTLTQILLLLAVATAAVGVVRVLTSEDAFSGPLVLALAIALAIAGPAIDWARGRAQLAAGHRERDRSLRAGAASTDPLVRDVSALDLHIRRPIRTDVEYIERDTQPNALDILRLTRRVLIVGPAMSGKSRMALTVAKVGYPDWRLYQPSDGGALWGRLAGGVSLPPTLVWLDDLQNAIASGLRDQELRTLLSDHGHAVVVATIRTNEYQQLLSTGKTILAGSEVLDWFGDPVRLQSRWSEQEVSRLVATRLGRELEGAARRFGLSCFLGGAPLIEERLMDAAGESPEGLAVVMACVGWRRAGMQRPLAKSEITRILPGYLTHSEAPQV